MNHEVKKRPQTKVAPGCEGCPAICCRDLSIWIGAPKTKSEIDDLTWELRYDTVRAYIRNRRWYLLIKGTCMYLDENNLCTIYPKRPQKCRDHNPPNCEKYGEFWDVMFNNPEELEAYLKKKKRVAKKRATARRKKKAG